MHGESFRRHCIRDACEAFLSLCIRSRSLFHCLLGSLAESKFCLARFNGWPENWLDQGWLWKVHLNPTHLRIDLSKDEFESSSSYKSDPNQDWNKRSRMRKLNVKSQSHFESEIESGSSLVSSSIFFLLSEIKDENLWSSSSIFLLEKRSRF